MSLILNPAVRLDAGIISVVKTETGIEIGSNRATDGHETELGILKGYLCTHINVPVNVYLDGVWVGGYEPQPQPKLYFVAGLPVHHPEDASDILIARGQVMTLSELKAVMDEFGMDNVPGIVCTSHEIASIALDFDL